MRVADIEVEPRQRVTHVATAQAGETRVEVPIIAVNGAQEGPAVAVTAGIHGAEYVGIEAARRLGMRLDPPEVLGSVVIVPVANTAAFYRRAIYVSGLDENNLNRVFPGSETGGPSEALAGWLFRTIIQPADYYIDMHGGDMIEALVPFVIYARSSAQEVERRAREMALAAGIPRVIRSETSGSTYSAASAAGIPAILTETGGQGVWSDELVEQHVESTLRVLRYLGVLEGDVAPASAQVFDTFAWARSEVAGLWYPFVAVGEAVEAGQTIGRITDYFGAELQRIGATHDGEIAFLVTALAVNPGDPLLAIAA